MLDEFLTQHRETILRRTRARVAARAMPVATPEELAVGVPLFVDQLIEILRSKANRESLLEASAMQHGQVRADTGFTIAQVVHDYGDVCQVVTELADELHSSIAAEEFGTFNLALDDAIAFAVTEFSRRREVSISEAGTERLGVLAHELRNLIHTAGLAYNSLRSGSVGIGGSTGALLGRTLVRLKDQVDRSLAVVRLDAGVIHPEPIVLCEFLEEVEVGAMLEAHAKGRVLTIGPVEKGMLVTADRQLLGSAVANLIHNALKFTPEGGQVSVSTKATPDRIAIEIEDQCGGLPEGKIEHLFGTFSQRSVDRSGLGLGLSISRRVTEAMGGELRARDLPGKGCVFTVELPRPVH